jgi:hypothetical protein
MPIQNPMTQTPIPKQTITVISDKHEAPVQEVKQITMPQATQKGSMLPSIKEDTPLQQEVPTSQEAPMMFGDKNDKTPPQPSIQANKEANIDDGDERVYTSSETSKTMVTDVEGEEALLAALRQLIPEHRLPAVLAELRKHAPADSRPPTPPLTEAQERMASSLATVASSNRGRPTTGMCVLFTVRLGKKRRLKVVLKGEPCACVRFVLRTCSSLADAKQAAANSIKTLIQNASSKFKPGSSTQSGAVETKASTAKTKVTSGAAAVHVQVLAAEAAAVEVGTAAQAAASKPVRGQVARKVHCVSKRLGEARQRARSCYSKVEQAASKCLNQLQQSLGRNK